MESGIPAAPQGWQILECRRTRVHHTRRRWVTHESDRRNQRPDPGTIAREPIATVPKDGSDRTPRWWNRARFQQHPDGDPDVERISSRGNPGIGREAPGCSGDHEGRRSGVETDPTAPRI